MMQVYLKSLAAAVIAALSTLSGLAANGPIHSAGYITVALAFFVALGAVWAVPNAPGATVASKLDARVGQIEAQLPAVPDLATSVTQGIVTGLQTLGYVPPTPTETPANE